MLLMVNAPDQGRQQLVAVQLEQERGHGGAPPGRVGQARIAAPPLLRPPHVELPRRVCGHQHHLRPPVDQH
jgi:hypothetical protein